MGNLIEALLLLSHVGRADLVRERVDLSAIAARVADDLRRDEPERTTRFTIEDGMTAQADANLVTVLLENLLGNAWKYTRRTPAPSIEVGTLLVDGSRVNFVRDNGAGFSMDQAETLFQPYKRLHTDAEFPGTGIGLATAHRVVDRHEGRIWATGHVGGGATFYFTLGPAG
jgi:light-regulated signal transduction histidine kinase (bacteriophytochrome)